MSKFEEVCKDGKCDVCNKESKVAVCASTMGPVSFSYCKECLSKGLEPYKIMVISIACAGKFPDGINEAYQNEVRRILKELGKTEEEFIVDVNKSFDENMEYWKSLNV